MLSSAVRAAVSQHLRKSGGSSAACQLADDLSILMCGIRSALLWDYWAVEDDSGDFSGGLSEAQLCGFLDGVRRAVPAAAGLGLVRIGPSVFVVRSSEIADRLEAEAAELLGGVELVACDAELPRPRPCDADERARVAGALAPIGLALAEQLRSRSATAGWEARHPPCGPLLVPLHGWLLGYPTLYCFVHDRADDDARGGSCLGGAPLCVVQLSARPARAAAEGAPAADRAPHAVCSFSMPSCDGPTLDLERPALRRWWTAARARFETEAAARCWAAPELSAATVVQEGVVL